MFINLILLRGLEIYYYKNILKIPIFISIE